MANNRHKQVPFYRTPSKGWLTTLRLKRIMLTRLRLTRLRLTRLRLTRLRLTRPRLWASLIYTAALGKFNLCLPLG